MNFKPELADAVMARRKTVTRRKVSENPRSPWWRERCAYRVGQDVAICPGRGKHAIGRARIISVERMARYDEAAVVWRIGLEALSS